MSENTNNSYGQGQQEGLESFRESCRMPVTNTDSLGPKDRMIWTEDAREALDSEGVHLVQRVVSLAMLIMRKSGRMRLISEDIQAAMDSLGLPRPYGVMFPSRMPVWRKVEGGGKVSDPLSTASFAKPQSQRPPPDEHGGSGQDTAWYLQSPLVRLDTGPKASSTTAASSTTTKQDHHLHHALGPKYPKEVPTLRMHWLAINGVQPMIPENPTEDQILSYAARQLDTFKRADPQYRKAYDAHKGLETFDNRGSLSAFAHATIEYNESMESQSRMGQQGVEENGVSDVTENANVVSSGAEFSRIFRDCEEFAQRLSVSKEESYFLRSIWNVVSDDDGIVSYSKLQESLQPYISEIATHSIEDIPKMSTGLQKAMEIDLQKRKGARQPLLITLGKDQQLPSGGKYLVQMVEDLVYKEDRSLMKLLNAMALTFQLLKNSYFQAETYLSQLIPATATCLFGDSLGRREDINHWLVRDLAARNYAVIFKKYGPLVPSLSARLEKLLEKVITDCLEDLPQADVLDSSDDLGAYKKQLRYRPLFGAIRGVELLGRHSAEMILAPSLRSLIHKLAEHVRKLDTLSEPEGRSPRKLWKTESRVVLAVLHASMSKVPQKHKQDIDQVWRSTTASPSSSSAAISS
eukprot:gb/GECG01013889.1/.p1 GENE.gb/GECG01013889.1/~~gb/GECG01013889.1/.p1  ORF type:complete len:634 (+),score=79.64 gb/GECG01013889.1/:1-1902(+)